MSSSASNSSRTPYRAHIYIYKPLVAVIKPPPLLSRNTAAPENVPILSLSFWRYDSPLEAARGFPLKYIGFPLKLLSSCPRAFFNLICGGIPITIWIPWCLKVIGLLYVPPSGSFKMLCFSIRNSIKTHMSVIPVIFILK